jgi:hypothetical protein
VKRVCDYMGSNMNTMFGYFFFKSYVASYVGPIQTGFLMMFLSRLRGNRNPDSDKDLGPQSQEILELGFGLGLQGRIPVLRP